MSKFIYFKQLVFSRPWKEVFSRMLELLFGYILYGISFLIPRKKRKWVFGTNVGYADNAKYLFLYTLNNTDIDSCWITDTSKSAFELQSQGLNAAYKYSAKGLYYCLTAGYYIFTYHSRDINFFTSGGAKKINLWHGVGIKKGSKFVSKSMPVWLSKILLPHLYEKFDLFLSTSPLMDKHFQEIFNLPYNIIYEGMYPRCSFLMQSQNSILQQIKATETDTTIHLVNLLQNYKQVYIYMPTWRINMQDTFLQIAGIDFQRINDLMQKQNALFLIKLHPAVKLEHQHEKYKNIIFIDKSQDIYPILPFTNFLITDYSSIYYDYLLMEGKQVLLFPFDIEDYRAKADELAFDYDTYTPGKRVFNFEELMIALQSAATNNGCQVEKRDWVLQQFWGDYKTKTHLKLLIEKILSL